MQIGRNMRLPCGFFSFPRLSATMNQLDGQAFMTQRDWENGNEPLQECDDITAGLTQSLFGY